MWLTWPGDVSVLAWEVVLRSRLLCTSKNLDFTVDLSFAPLPSEHLMT